MARDKIVFQEKYRKREAPLIEPQASKVKQALEVDEVFLDEQGIVERDGVNYECLVIRSYKKLEED